MLGRKLAQPIVLDTLVVAALMVQHDMALLVRADPRAVPRGGRVARVVDDEHAHVVLGAGYI